MHFECEVCGKAHETEEALKNCCQIDLMEAIASLVELEREKYEMCHTPG
ncbi:hypothetical protein [Wohlfahrtiimonas larvae]|uniref:Uncharacterized protein n=1 Tax=Wohlfahrtiimonas larvae TaxID=1157986 RepID=A0ABP9MV40_9GAMM|nr:hypothetical protein [Wohlfahrtiimonas larvae]